MGDQRVIGALTRNIYPVNVLYSKVVFGGSGAVASQTLQLDSGMVVTIVAAKDGRYLVTLHRDFKLLGAVSAIVVGPTDAAMAIASGTVAVVRNINVGVGTQAGTFEIQLIRTDTGADADPTSGNELLLGVAVQSQSTR